MAWSPDSTCLASGGEDGRVYLWEAASGRLLGMLHGHHGGVRSLAWSPDGTQLATGGGSRGMGELFVWDAQRGECLSTFVHVGTVLAVVWNPSGEMLVSGDSEGRLRWWNIEREECVREHVGHQGAVLALRRSPDGRLLASGGDDGAVHLWELASGEWRQTLRRDRPYERLDMTGVRGLTEAQKTTLRSLGAVESENAFQCNSSLICSQGSAK